MGVKNRLLPVKLTTYNEYKNQQQVIQHLGALSGMLEHLNIRNITLVDVSGNLNSNRNYKNLVWLLCR